MYNYKIDETLKAFVDLCHYVEKNDSTIGEWEDKNWDEKRNEKVEVENPVKVTKKEASALKHFLDMCDLYMSDASV